MGRIAITGSTGFVGRYLAATLVREGVEVVGVARPGSGELPSGVARAPIIDLSDRTGLIRGFKRADAVVHLGARVHVLRETVPDPLEAFRHVNVEGTRTVMAAAAESGVRRLVYASTIKVFGEQSPRPWVETDSAAPTEAYGRSKLEAEGVVLEEGARAGLDVSVLRLPLVYGPGVGANMLRLFRAVDRRLPIPIGGIRNRRSLLFVGNLAAAVQLLLCTGRGQEVYHVTDLHDLSTPELVASVGAALGRSVHLPKAPLALMRLVGQGGDLVNQVISVPFTTAALDRLTGSLSMDASKLVRVTGYSPPFTVTEGLAETARWYRAIQQRRDS